MTMTTREVTIFISELGQLRQDLGKFVAKLEAIAPELERLARLSDERGERIDKLERSIYACQEACGRERSNRSKVVHWIAYAIAGLVPGAATWYLTRHTFIP